MALRRGSCSRPLQMFRAVRSRQTSASEHVGVELISEHASLLPGQSQQLGILLRHEPHWHTYWINPGDSGLPTTLAWNTAGGLQEAGHCVAVAEALRRRRPLQLRLRRRNRAAGDAQRAGRCASRLDRAHRSRCEMARLPRGMHSGQGVADARSPRCDRAAETRRALDDAIRARAPRRAAGDRMEGHDAR